MRKVYFFVLLLCSSPAIFASHFSAMSLRYNAVTNANGGVDLEVFATLIRSTDGIPAPNTITLNYTSTNCSDLSFTATQFGSGGFEPITRKCFDVNGESNYEQEVLEYRGFFTISSVQCGLGKIFFRQCCRSTLINNIGGNQTLYVDLDVNVSMVDGNGNFTNQAPEISYQNMWFEFMVGKHATSGAVLSDADGDSLHVKLVNSLDANVNGTLNVFTIPFANGYSLSNPIKAAGIFNLNAKTGEFDFTPSSNERATLTFEVEEWRLDTGNTYAQIGKYHYDTFVSVFSNSNPNSTGIQVNSDSLLLNNTYVPKLSMLCEDSVLQVNFDQALDFNSISASHSEFRITNTKSGFAVPIKKVQGIADTSIGYRYGSTLNFELFFPVQTNDTLLLEIQSGTDRDGLSNVCNSNALLDTTILITVSGCPYANLDERTNHTFHVYPNPAKTALQVSFKTPGRKHMEVFNLAGIQVNSFTEVLNGTNYTMSLSNLPTGMYMLRVIDEAGVIHSKRFVKE